MSENPEPVRSSAHGAPVFATTHWSVVLTAAEGDPACAAEALETLCRTYWYPLYAFVRRKGHPPAEAEDLTQGFFERLLSRDFPAGIKPDGGRFRSYLLSALRHYLVNEWEKVRTQKRGSGQVLIPLHDLDAEGRYQQDAVDGMTPESLYDRRWAASVLETVRGQLRREYEAEGRLDLYQVLEPMLTGSERQLPYAVLGEQLDCSVAAVKMAVHRLRRRYGTLLRAEIGRTVATPEAVDDELQSLLSAL